MIHLPGSRFMSFATVMVYVDPDYTRTQIVRIAVQLAAKFDSRLTGVSAIPIRLPVVANGVVVATVTEAEIDQMTRRLREKEDWFRQTVGGVHDAIDWRSELDFPTEFLISQTRGADLVVVNPNSGFLGAYNSLDTAGVILKSGRPVLVAPDEVQTLRADRIVIGWKDTREARRAITDALPFLHQAERVTIAGICEEGDERATMRSIDDVVRHLARHRVKGGPNVILHPEGSTATRLLRLASDEGADLLVAGAYGHSRLGEWVFGGVTQELLSASPICCLMSH
jgi:nucleotide-binding universal stress UspA family protein